MMQPTHLDNKPQPTETLFDKIYRIAKTSETQLIIPELKKTLTHDICLDVCNSQGDTVAGKLAAEGNQAAVKELIKLGANINLIAYGAALGGHREYAEWLRHHYGADASLIAQGAARGGHREYAEWLRQQCHASLKLIALGAAEGGFQDYVEFLHLNGDSNVLGAIARGLNQSRHLSTEKLALRYLAFIQNDHHRVALSHALLSHALNASELPFSYDILGLLPRARQIQATMQRYGLHYDQALAWTHPEIQSLFLYSSHLTQSKHLPEDLILSLSFQLAPLTLADAEKLLEVAKLIRARALLTAELNRYYASSGRYLFGFLGRNPRARDLAERCTKANDLKTLTLLLDNEIKVPVLTEIDKKYQDFLSQQRATLSSRLLIKFNENETTTAQETEAKPTSSQGTSETTASSARANVSSSSSSYRPSP